MTLSPVEHVSYAVGQAGVHSVPEGHLRKVAVTPKHDLQRQDKAGQGTTAAPASARVRGTTSGNAGLGRTNHAQVNGDSLQ